MIKWGGSEISKRAKSVNNFKYGINKKLMSKPSSPKNNFTLLAKGTRNFKKRFIESTGEEKT